MDNIQDREEWRRERSLRALGRAMRGDGEASPARSLLAIAAEADRDEEGLDPRTRHSFARARREAMMEAESRAARLPEELEEPVRQTREPATMADRGDGANRSRPAADRVPAVATRRRSWRLVVATTLLGACLGAALAFSLPTRYQATAELSVGADGAERSAAGALESQLRILTSGMVLTKVVDRLNLADDPEFNGRNGGEGFSGLLHTILVRGDAGPDDGHRQALAVDRLSGSLSVARGDSAGSLAVTVTTGNGEKSALIANAVADTFVQIHERDRSGTATGSIGDLNEAAPRQRLNEFTRDHGLGDLTNDPDRVAEILKLDNDLKAARARTETLNAKVAALRSVGVDAAAVGLPPAFESGAIAALRTQYLDIKRQADSAAVKLGPRNPERRGIEAQLAGARDRLSAELRRIATAQQAALKQAVETEQGYAARLAKTGLSGEDIATLRDLHDEAAAEIDRQAITASIAADASGAAGRGAHVVSRATTPSRPIGPPRMALTLAGTVMGLFAGLGLGILRGEASGIETGGIETEGAPDSSPLDPQEPIERWDRDLPFVEDETWGRRGYPADSSPLWPTEAAPPSGEPPPASPVYQSGSSDFSAIPDSMEPVMQPFYTDQAFSPEQQLQDQPRRWFQPAGYPPQAYAPPPMMQPPYLPQPYPQAWQPAPPMQPYPHAHPMQAYGGQYQPPQSAFPYAMQDTRPASVIDQDAIDEIRASLREFREALRELTESRPRRRIF